MDAITDLTLPSGLDLHRPLHSLLRFCHEEYPYYDAIPSANPGAIEPIDVLATVSMNSFVNSATAVRRVHRGMATHCNPVLATIPEHADLLTYEAATLGQVRSLLLAAIRARGVLIPVATKVLHRKRRALIPMLDRVVIEHYRPGYTNMMQDKGDLATPAHDSKREAIADRAMEVLQAFRVDLQHVTGELDVLRQQLGAEGFPLTSLRILELLVWMHTEPNHYYVEAS